MIGTYKEAVEEAVNAIRSACRYTPGKKKRKEITDAAEWLASELILRNQNGLWMDEAIQKIVPEKAAEIQQYVFSCEKAEAMKRMPWLREVEMGQAEEE